MGVYTSIHPGLFCCQTSLECADYKAECLWFCRVTSCVLFFLVVESKKGLIKLKIVFFSLSSKILLLWNIQVTKENLTVSVSTRFAELFPSLNWVLIFQWLVSVHRHQVSWAGRSADLLRSRVYPTASRFINVENCKLNPERPNLRFVSCFSNVNIKGQNSANQGLPNGQK